MTRPGDVLLESIARATAAAVKWPGSDIGECVEAEDAEVALPLEATSADGDCRCPGVEAVDGRYTPAGGSAVEPISDAVGERARKRDLLSAPSRTGASSPPSNTRPAGPVHIAGGGGQPRPSLLQPPPECVLAGCAPVLERNHGDTTVCASPGSGEVAVVGRTCDPGPLPAPELGVACGTACGSGLPSGLAIEIGAGRRRRAWITQAGALEPQAPSFVPTAASSRGTMAGHARAAEAEFPALPAPGGRAPCMDTVARSWLFALPPAPPAAAVGACRRRTSADSNRTAFRVCVCELDDGLAAAAAAVRSEPKCSFAGGPEEGAPAGVGALKDTKQAEVP